MFFNQKMTRVGRNVIQNLGKKCTLVIGRLRVIDEICKHYAVFQHNTLKTQFDGNTSEAHNVTQLFLRVGYGTKPAFKTCKKTLQLIFFPHIVQFFI